MNFLKICQKNKFMIFFILGNLFSNSWFFFNILWKFSYFQIFKFMPFYKHNRKIIFVFFLFLWFFIKFMNIEKFHEIYSKFVNIFWNFMTLFLNSWTFFIIHVHFLNQKTFYIILDCDFANLTYILKTNKRMLIF